MHGINVTHLYLRLYRKKYLVCVEFLMSIEFDVFSITLKTRVWLNFVGRNLVYKSC